MAFAAPAAGPPTEPAHTRRTLQLVLLSGLSLVVQVAGTDYGDSGRGPAVAWFVVGVVLLWFVYRRRNRVALFLAVGTALLRALVYALRVVEEGPHAAVLAVAFLGQALPLLAGPVRRHVLAQP